MLRSKQYNNISWNITLVNHFILPTKHGTVKAKLTISGLNFDKYCSNFKIRQTYDGFFT